MAGQQWWVLQYGTTSRTKIVASASKPAEAGWKVLLGPYPTEAAAESAIGAVSKTAHPATPPVAGIAQGWHDVTSTADAVTKFGAELSDAGMWRSLGWLALGVAMMGSGAYLWLRQSGGYRAAGQATASQVPVIGQAAVAADSKIEDAIGGRKIRTPFGDAPVIPILFLLTGGYLAWFGVHYWRDRHTIWPSDPVKDVLRGLGLPKPDRSPSVADQVSTVSSGPGSQAGQFGEASGDAIAKDAASYAGKVPYVWGGASPATGWDCSGMVNYVLDHDMGLDIPGYRGSTFSGQAHGPNVAGWLASSLVDVVHAGPVS